MIFIEKNIVKKNILLTESELTDLIKKIIKEQNATRLPQKNQFTNYQFNNQERVSGLDNYPNIKYQQQRNFETLSAFEKYKCVPRSVIPFILSVEKNKSKIMGELQIDNKTLSILTKAAIGIIGRETKFGTVTEFSDKASEFLRTVGLSFIPQITDNLMSPQSLGTAQFTPETWKNYGLDKKVGDFNHSFNIISQGLAALYRVTQDYKLALSKGLSTKPSVNPIAVKQGKITNVNGTGNNSLDLAILAHNFGNKKIGKYCTTNNSNFATLCSNQTVKPYPTDKPNFILTVNQNQEIPNFFPNLSSGANGGHTSIGYLEEVAAFMKNYNCVTF